MDVVVTCPQHLWREWIHEGDNALADHPDGAPWRGEFEYSFYISGRGRPNIDPGERVYIIAYGQLRGWAPLVRVQPGPHGMALVRHGGAVACTLATPVPGFRGFRYRWWDRALELPFPDWQDAGTPWAPPFPWFDRAAPVVGR